MGLLSTPISAGVRMAKEILSLRAQGRASEVTNEMMDAADPQYMFDNTPLPMDEASRLLRANAAGASTDMYHMTDKDFNAFANPSRFGMQGKGVYVAKNPPSDMDVPNGLGDLINKKDGLFSEGTNLMPLRFTGESFDESIQRLDPFSDEGTAVLKRFGLKPNKTYSKIKGAEEGRDISEQLYDLASRQATKKHGNQRTPEWLEELKSSLNSRLKKAGYASTEDSYTGYQMAFDPKNVRSKFARFDPEFSHLSNTLASNPVATAAAVAGGLLAMTSSEDADAGVVGKSLDNIIKAANKQGVKLDVFENKKKGSLELSRIVVPEKSKGVGTSIMNDLAEYADKTGQTVSLSPSTDFGGTSKRRLTEFYKRFGFVQNKGKNKDYTISNSMYRSPSIKSSNPVATTSAGLLANVTGQPSNLSSYMQGNTDAYLTNEERQYLQNKQAFESNFSNDTGWDRADILPFRVNEQTGEREFATPEMIKGLLSGLYDIGQSKNTKISNPASLLELI